MKTNIIFIRLGGVINLLAALLHVSFWSAFDWSHQLTELSIVNSNVMQMLNLFTIVFFVYVGILLLAKPKQVSSTLMGRHFLGMLMAMWTARLAMEFYFPEGSLVFAVVLVFSILCFTYPLVKSIKVKSRLNSGEHLKHPWQVHALLEDFEIEDVWKLPVEMTKDQPVADVQSVFGTAINEISRTGVAGWLFQFRFFLGRVFGWDAEVSIADILPQGSIRERYARQQGLTADDFSTKQGAEFIPVYQMKDEALAEIENGTVHAAVHYGKVPAGNDSYTIQMTVYVKPKGLLGKTYMQLIKPFRLYIVYPIMLKVIEKHWEKQQQTQVELEPAVS